MENNRAQWGSKIGFILAAAGSAVGLGNIWKFPGKAFEGGGGAYILIYLAIVVLIGFPVMLSELTIGRAAQANAIDSFHKLGYRGFKWVGVTGVAVAFIVTSYYCHVGGWVLRYVVSYITEAQTVYADPLGYFYGLLGYNAATGETWFPLTAILFAAVFMAVNAVIIIKGVEGGIEKFNKVGMPALFIILIVLLARTITLDGAQAGFAYMLSCDWSKVGFNTFLSALGQAFFSLSVTGSGMIVYGAYLSKDEDVVDVAQHTALFDTIAAVVAALVIIPACFSYGLDVGAGPSLLFVTLPTILQDIPLGRLFAIILYVAMIFAGVSSLQNMFEAVAESLMHKFPRLSRTAVLVILCVVCLGFGIGMETIDKWGPWMDLVSIYIIPIGATLGAISWFYVMKKDELLDAVNTGSGKLRGNLWYSVGRYVYVPLAVILCCVALFMHVAF